MNHSINESILNTSKLQRVFRLCDSYLPSTISADNPPKALNWDSSAFASPPEVYFVINNLVSAMVETAKSHAIWESLFENVSPTFRVLSFSFEIDKEIGFFEYNGLLLCKKINLSFTLRPNMQFGKFFKLQQDGPNDKGRTIVDEFENTYLPTFVKRLF